MKKINASVERMTDALTPMPPGLKERVVDRVQHLPGGCIQSSYAVKAGGGPQLMWQKDGDTFYMYHWRLYYYVQLGYMPEPFSLVRNCLNSRCVNPDHRVGR